jgi:hypothetical protein
MGTCTSIEDESNFFEYSNEDFFENFNEQEKFLKEFLKIITPVNEICISEEEWEKIYEELKKIDV